MKKNTTDPYKQTVIISPPGELWADKESFNHRKWQKKLNAQCLVASWRLHITQFPCPAPYLTLVSYIHRMEPVRPCILCEAAQLHCVSYKEQDEKQWNHSHSTRSCQADCRYMAASSPTHRVCRMWLCNILGPWGLCHHPPSASSGTCWGAEERDAPTLPNSDGKNEVTPQRRGKKSFWHVGSDPRKRSCSSMLWQSWNLGIKIIEKGCLEKYNYLNNI